MKKGLIGLLIVSLILVFSVGAMAEVNQKLKGNVGIYVTSYDYKANGAPYFEHAYADLQWDVWGSSGPWESHLRLNSMFGDKKAWGNKFGAPMAARVKAWIAYTGEDVRLRVDPTGINPGIYSSQVQTAMWYTDVPKIPPRPGLMIEMPMDSFTPYLYFNNIYNKDANEVFNNIAGGVKFKRGYTSVDVLYNSMGEKNNSQIYGTSLGTIIVWYKKPLKLTGEYGVFIPAAGNSMYTDQGTGYYAQFKYYLPAGSLFSCFYFAYYYVGANMYTINEGETEGYYTKPWSCIKFKGYFTLAKGLTFAPYLYLYDKAGEKITRIRVKFYMNFK